MFLTEKIPLIRTEVAPLKFHEFLIFPFLRLDLVNHSGHMILRILDI